MNDEMSIKWLGNKISYTGLCNAEKFSRKLLDLSPTSSSIHSIVINLKNKNRNTPLCPLCEK